MRSGESGRRNSGGGERSINADGNVAQPLPPRRATNGRNSQKLTCALVLAWYVAVGAAALQASAARLRFDDVEAHGHGYMMPNTKKAR